MKRKMTFSLTLALSLLLSLVSLPATARAAPPQRFGTHSGVVTLPATQMLRITVAGIDANDTIRVRLRWMQYGVPSCSGMPAVCRHMVVSQGATAPETLGPGDALSFDVQDNGGSGVQVVLESNSRRVRVLGVVFDTSTQRVMATLEFDTELLSLN